MRWFFQGAAVGALALVAIQPAISQTNQGTQSNQGTQNQGSQNAGSQNSGEGSQTGVGQSTGSAGQGGNAPVRPSGPGQTDNRPTIDTGGLYPENNEPWFANDNLQNELELDEDQIERLTDIYNQTGSELQGRSSGEQLSDEARSERMREMRNRFDDEFSRRTSNVFRDENQRNRFNQLGMQFRGYSAFDNPRLQRELNLNDTQRRQLQDLNNQWNTELETLRGTYAGDRTGTEQRFNQLRDRTRTSFEGILNDQQRTAYDQMIGNRFDFGPSSYLQGTQDHLRSAQRNSGGSGLGTQLDSNTGSGLLSPPGATGSDVNKGSDAGNTGAGTSGGVGAGTGSGAGAGTGSGTGAGTGGGAGASGSGSGGAGGGSGGSGS